MSTYIAAEPQRNPLQVNDFQDFHGNLMKTNSRYNRKQNTWMHQKNTTNYRRNTSFKGNVKLYKESVSV